MLNAGPNQTVAHPATQPNEVKSMSERSRRVVILADSQTHMMPALAREMARREHDLVLGDPLEGLAAELSGQGVRVEVVDGAEDQMKPDTIQKLVDRAHDAFGGFDAACIRTGVHGTGSILEATEEDCQIQYEGNFRSVFYALKALLPPLVEQRSGQVVINTSAGASRPRDFAALYCAQRAGANALVQASALAVAEYGVTVNATGTYAMNYASFLHDVGADTDPERRKAVEAEIPMKRLCEPEEAAHFVATLIDGVGTYQTGQFFSMDGGWAFM